jgi:uncharacterized membrane protein
MFLAVILLSLIWIMGIIFADFKFFIFGLLIVCFLIVLYKNNKDALKNFRTPNGNVVKDERDESINEKAGHISFEIIKPIMVLVGVGIFTLRDIYPQYIMIAYTLFLTVIISFITKKIATFYYKRRYD